MTFINILLAAVWLIILPILFGGVVYCFIAKRSFSLSEVFSLGTFSLWALFQLIAVPLIQLKVRFTLLVIIASAIAVVIILFGVVRFRKRIFPDIHPRSYNKSDWAMMVVLFLVFVWVIYNVITHQSTDDDDSRFVVNAVDMILTDRLFLTNPATGYAIPAWTGELVRDVASPWAAYQAVLSQLCMVHPTIFIHTIQPVALFIVLFSVQWQLSACFFKESISSRAAFCIFAWVLILFGESNGWTAEGFLLERIWQGKAVVASIGIPYLFVLFLSLYEHQKKEIYWILGIFSIGMSLLSNMGIIFGAALTGVFGLIYGLVKKNRKLMVYTWLTAIPYFVFGILSQFM